MNVTLKPETIRQIEGMAEWLHTAKDGQTFTIKIELEDEPKPEPKPTYSDRLYAALDPLSSNTYAVQIAHDKLKELMTDMADEQEYAGDMGIFWLKEEIDRL